MADQTEIHLGNEYVRSTDPDTSQAAAAALTPKKLSKLKLEILQYFKEAHELGRLGVTDDELVRHFDHLKESSARRRRTDLTKAGFIGDTGERRWVDGSTRIVWALASIIKERREKEAAALRASLEAEVQTPF